MFQEVLVVDYIADYSKLTSEQIQKISKDVVGVNFLSNCPNGTIIGVKIGKDSDLQKRVYFPFFSHISFPIKSGERAWIFEPGNSRVSYWMSRKVQNSSAEDLNFTNDDNARLYLALGNEPNAREKASGIIFDANSAGVSLQGVRDDAISKSEFVGEAVFPVSKTSLDLLLQGSNGSAIILRNLGEQGTGTVDLVAGIATAESGRKILNSRNETSLKPPLREDNTPELGNLSPDDESRVTVSRSFNSDSYYSLPGDDSGSQPSISLKSDSVRVIAKNDLKIVVGEGSDPSSIIIKSNGDIVVTPSLTGVIKLGGDDATGAILACQTALNTGGTVVGTPIVDTAGGVLGVEGVPATGVFATKILVKV